LPEPIDDYWRILMETSPELKLRTAASLVEEVSSKIDPFKSAVARSDAAWDASFWGGVQSQWQVGREAAALMQDLNEAVDLASEAAEGGDVSVEIRDGEDAIEFTSTAVLAEAHLALGVLHAIQKDWTASEHSLRASLEDLPTPDAQLRLGSVLFAARRPEAAEEIFRKVIDDYPDSPEAVEAMKAVRELERGSPKRWSLALTLAICFGWAGLDRFYLGYTGSGIAKFFTAGGWFIWWIVDAVRIGNNTMLDASGRRLKK
jgi:tetratricopeptide (TPR) repeat protein